MEKKRNRILVDVDGTITIGPGPAPHLFAPVQNGARAFLGALKDRGFEVVVFSARSPVELVKKFFREQDMTRFVDGFTRTKLPSRLIVDDRALTYRGNYEQTLKEIDGFKTHWEEKPSYAYSMFPAPEPVASKVLEFGRKVAEADLAEDGRESEPHVTVYWGLDSDDPKLLQEAVRGFGEVEIVIESPSLFETPRADVLKLGIQSEGLHRLHEVIRAKVPHVDTHPDYKPHLTVAYCKTGTGAKYLSEAGLTGLRFTAAALIFMDRHDTRHEIPLA